MTGLDGDPGGVPFDDDFDDGAPTEPGDRGGVAGAPAYDSGTILQSRGIGYPSSAPVGMTQLRSYVTARWGGSDLGILSVPPRPMRGSGSPSLHNWGMAWDWRWANPGPGRGAADDVIEFCIGNCGVLGIQAVHDYVSCRYWKSYQGWDDATASSASGFGESWAQWLHIERTWAAANDGRSVEAILGGKVAPEVLPAPVVKVGDKGANVAKLQEFLRRYRFVATLANDGEFGPRTLDAVKAAQKQFKSKGWYDSAIDGEYGPRSAAAAAKFLDSRD